MEHTGKIGSSFNYEKGIGHVISDSDQTKLFLLAAKIEKQSEIIALVSTKALEGESVIFNIETGHKGPIAVNVRLDLSKRSVGYVRETEDVNGPKIEDFKTKNIYLCHFSNVKGSSERFVRFKDGEPIIFTQQGKNAVQIVQIDKRNPLELFAEFSNFEKSILTLATAPNLAETKNEYWDYIQKPTRRLPVLSSYLNQTFSRINLQDKIIRTHSKEGREYAIFNTGLVTKEQDEIYAYFDQNDRFQELTGWGVSTPKLKFLEFNTDQSKYSKYFSELPVMATFFEDAEITQLIFDTSKKVTPVWKHIIERKDRFLKNGLPNPDIQKLSDDEFIDKIKAALSLATRRAKRNYKTAIPHFYDNKIQFLLPLCVTNKVDADVALVVNRDENSYVAHTILNLDQAFNNARLLAKPDREWLTP